MVDSGLPNLDLDALTKTATSAPPVSESNIVSLMDRLKKVEAAKESDPDLARVRQENVTSFEENRMRAAEKLKGIDPTDVQPWTQKPPEPKPLEAFGSWASMFAIAASAFTHTPAINAMNGAAAAMNAFRANDLQNYRSAFEAWKENTHLAVERHKAQYEDYQAAVEKMKIDMVTGHAMLSELSAKYGDQDTAIMNEAGLYKDLDQVWSARQRAAEGMLQLYPTLLKTGEQHEMLLSDPDWLSNDPKRKAAAVQRVTQAFSAVGGRLTEASTKEGEIVRQLQAFADENGREATPSERLKIIHDVETAFKAPSSGAGSALTGFRADAIQKQIKEKEDKLGRPLTGGEESQIVNDVMKGGLTGNLKEKMQARVDQFGYSMDKIDEAVGTLDRYIGAAGIAGKGLRLKERVGNIFGNNQTDRVQFMRTIEYLQANAPRLLVDTNGRPLSKEADKIMDIIGGLNVGDTTANTKRSLEEIKSLYEQMRADTQLRMSGEWEPKPSGGGASPPASKPMAPSSGGQSWRDAPVVE